MINTLSVKWHRLKSDRSSCFIVMSIMTLFGLQLTNMVLLRLLGLPNTACPWSFIGVLSYGFVIPVFIAFAVVFCPMIASVLWFLGGLKRAMANTILVYWFAVIAGNWLGLYGFIIWDGLNIKPYPWLIYSLLIQLPANGYYHLIISLIISYSLLFIVIGCRYFSVTSNANKVFGKAHFASSLEIKQSGLFSDEGIVLGKAYGKRLKLPGFESVLVTAPTGSGKTTAIAIPNLIEWQGSAVVNDLKGELYRTTADYRQTHLNNKCYLWAPANANKQTHCYNPFAYVSKNPELRIRDLQLIAEVLIPAERVDGGFWYTSSRDIFLMLALYLLDTKGMATLADIHDLSKQDDFFEWLHLTVEQGTINDLVFIQNATSLLNADQDKTRKNILKDFHSRMTLFVDPIVRHATKQNDIDLTKLRKEKTSIYIHIPDADKTRLKPILTLFWAQLIHLVSQQEPSIQEEPYPVLALLDEFGNMAKINQLNDGMTFLRSYRMRSIIMVQHLSQIKSVYGQEDAKSFLNSKIKIAYALNDMDDAEFFSRALGQKTVQVNSSSITSGHGDRAGSRSSTTSYRSRALMSADEIMQMKPNQQIILMESRMPIKAKKCYWFKDSWYKSLLPRFPVG